MERPDFYIKKWRKSKTSFTDKEYNQRVKKLRSVMEKNNLEMIILTSIHNMAYYTGFIYCSLKPCGNAITNKSQLFQLI